MRAVVSKSFAAQLRAAPGDAQRAFLKQLDFLLADRRHPSLNAKKYPEGGDPELWQARVNDDWRFYFRIQGDAYILDSIRPHPK
jgi:plasmid maintenance system killer protein